MLNGWTTITIEWALTLLTLTFVITRVYVRFASSIVYTRFGDVILFLAWLAMTVMVAMNTVLAKLYLFEPPSYIGEGMVTKNDRPEDNVRMMKILYGSLLPYTLSIYLVKFAICAYYYAATPRSVVGCRAALHLVFGFCAVSFVAAVGFNFLWCWPVTRNWTLDGPRLCVSSAQDTTYSVTFGCHIACNLLLFGYLYPLFRYAVVSQVMPKAGACRMAFIFTLGILTLVSTMARFTAAATGATSSVIAVWTTVEVTAAIGITCCPVVHTLIQSAKPAVRIHLKKSPSPTYHSNSTDTCGTSRTVRTTLGACEIWDGTDSTAPEWIRLGSRGVSGSMGKDIEIGGFLGSRGGEGVSEDSISHSPPTSCPGFILQPGRGIIQHAPGITQPEGTPCWMDLPDPPFLCESNDDGHNQKLNAPPKPKVRWQVEDGGRVCVRNQGTRESGDGRVLQNRDRWDSMGSGRLDRIVETLTEPAAAATKRWSQGSIVDRGNRRQAAAVEVASDDEERAVISKEAFYFD